MKRFKKRGLVTIGIAVATVLAMSGLAMAYYSSTGGGTSTASAGTNATLVINQTNNVLYDSTIPPSQTQFSMAFEATQTSEFGNEITLPKAAADPNVVDGNQLNTVTVTMDSWACQSGTFSTPSTAPCTTTTLNARFRVPITFTIYHAEATGVVGTVIATKTQTFTIPFRPSSTTTHCSTGQLWFNTSATAAALTAAGIPFTADTTCEFALTNNVTFTFKGTDVFLPSQYSGTSTAIVYGISFTTQTNTTPPVGGTSGPVTALNVALTTTGAATNDVFPGQLDVKSKSAASYCTTTSAHPRVGTFGLTATGCFATTKRTTKVYMVPAVKFTSVNPVSPTLFPGGAAQPIDYSVHNPGGASEKLTKVTISATTSVSTCTATWFKVTEPPAVGDILAPGQTIDFSNASIRMVTSGTTQDACKNATVTLTFSSD